MSTSDLTHEEIWDDRDLVNSWNEALAEYKKYHSIAARGENIDALLQAFEESNGTDLGAVSQVPGASVDEAQTNATDVLGERTTTTANEAMNIDKDTTPAAAANQNTNHAGETAGNGQASQQLPFQTQAVPPSTGALSAVLPTIQDEAMRNLMMSWYYAGYYTGIQEGQQRAYAEMQARNAQAGDAATG
ncbi:hypothetical protein MBLNU457_g0456t1 [Dothideomycetes sp. NU457]